MLKKRLGSGHLSAAYQSPDKNSIILFSIDPLKDVLCEMSGDNPCFPVINKLGSKKIKDETISVYQIEPILSMTKLDALCHPFARQAWTEFHELIQVKPVYRRYSKTPTAEQFWKWYHKLLRIKGMENYADALATQFDYMNSAYGDDISIDFHIGNVGVRPGGDTLVFYDCFILEFMRWRSGIRRRFPDPLLRELYNELAIANPTRFNYRTTEFIQPMLMAA